MAIIGRLVPWLSAAGRSQMAASTTSATMSRLPGAHAKRFADGAAMLVHGPVAVVHCHDVSCFAAFMCWSEVGRPAAAIASLGRRHARAVGARR